MKKYAVLGVAVVVALGLVASSWAACGSAKCGSGEKKIGCGVKAPVCSDAQKAACAAEGKTCELAKKAGCASKGRGEWGKKGFCGRSTSVGGAADSHSYGTIDTKGLQSLVRAGVPVTLVDARGGKYDDGTRIPGALNIPAGSSKSDIASALPDKDALVVAYCSNLKCPASAMLADQLVELGYKNVVKYPAGIAEWIESGNEVTGKSDG